MSKHIAKCQVVPYQSMVCAWVQMPPLAGSPPTAPPPPPRGRSLALKLGGDPVFSRHQRRLERHRSSVETDLGMRHRSGVEPVQLALRRLHKAGRVEVGDDALVQQVVEQLDLLVEHQLLRVPRLERLDEVSVIAHQRGDERASARQRGLVRRGHPRVRLVVVSQVRHIAHRVLKPNRHVPRHADAHRRALDPLHDLLHERLVRRVVHGVDLGGALVRVVRRGRERRDARLERTKGLARERALLVLREIRGPLHLDGVQPRVPLHVVLLPRHCRPRLLTTATPTAVGHFHGFLLRGRRRLMRHPPLVQRQDGGHLVPVRVREVLVRLQRRDEVYHALGQHGERLAHCEPPHLGRLCQAERAQQRRHQNAVDAHREQHDHARHQQRARWHVRAQQGGKPFLHGGLLVVEGLAAPHVVAPVGVEEHQRKGKPHRAA
mmetsp:Transcript_37992/g.88913  ORF Transcript_37992/g.88913 Transcript_37992/m.88913 type:complete len:434 (-) Transcript_37992:1168-2469(-)